MFRSPTTSILLLQVLGTLLLREVFIGVSNAQLLGSNFERFLICDFQNTSFLYSKFFRVKGWVQQSNYRGTFDILWISLASIEISTYTMLCLNVPASTDTWIQLIGRRVLWYVGDSRG